MIRNRLLFVLVAAGLLVAFGLPFLAHAPNRLVSGTGVSLAEAVSGVTWLALLPGLALLAMPFLPARRRTHKLVALIAALFLIALCWLAGAAAVTLAVGEPPAARTSLGSGFWLLFLCGALALIDAIRRLELSTLAGVLIGGLVLAAIAALGAAGFFDRLSLAQELANRHEVFEVAVERHVWLVLGALVPAVLIGVPLGFWAHRRSRASGGLFAVLNLIQTIPSMALFGLLIAPLAGLVALMPWLGAFGIAGIGPTPALIALVAYSLLPIARNTAEGLAGVPPAAVEAGRGMGMTGRQLFWKVELPLALPVFLTGLRITAVQAVGLAAVAALIGAGGLGAIMFEGLFANALDLVVLGALPVALLALAVDGLFRVAVSLAEALPR